MRWVSLKKELTEWHDWFAWRPAAVGGQIVWLETVERLQIVTHASWAGLDWPFVYRFKQKEQR